VPAQEVNLQAEIEQLDRELAEIDLLLQQTATEAERHETRRIQQAERVALLERSPETEHDALNEARSQLIVFTGRAALMGGQTQVLEGKQKVLRRFRDYLDQLLPLVGGESAAMPDEAPPDAAAASRALLAAQEEMRREIARQMHDGPAQSIANIALQAQVVQRLLQRDPAQAEAELTRLNEMVEHALDSTKAFIFEVRPMVLDDLGLVATLRRSSLDKARRSGVRIRFESIGQDRRLDSELESGLFRIIQDAIDGFVNRQPAEVTIGLDWTESEVRAAVHSYPPAPEAHFSQWQPPSLDDEADLPPALAGVIHERQEYEATKAAERLRATALPPEVWADIEGRATALGIEASLTEDSHLVEVKVQMASTE
jgi:two-component system, NarL family, sensor histidine kinase DegS